LTKVYNNSKEGLYRGKKRWKKSSWMIAIKNMSYYYQGYLALGEEICTVLPFKGYYTLKYER
jgi:hypothetical protein